MLWFSLFFDPAAKVFPEKLQLYSMTDVLSLVAAGQVDSAIPLLDDLFSDDVPFAAYASKVATLLTYCFENDSDASLRLAQSLLQHVIRKGPAAHEHNIRAREILADHYESRGQYRDLMTVLSGIPSEETSGLRSASPDFRFAVAVRLMNAALLDGDIAVAEQHHKNALMVKKHVLSSADSEAFAIAFTSCQARLRDKQRKFLDAAVKYHEWSLKCCQSEVRRALERAVVCAFLADAGPQRSKLLVALSTDERTAALGDLCNILSSMCASRLVRPADVSIIEPLLDPHQRALTSSGKTCLQVAVVQHNLHAASHFYVNIRLSALAELLGVSERDAEKTAAQMISEGRLYASIDQVEGYLYFDAQPAADTECTVDQHIAGTCNAVASLSNQILAAHPEMHRRF